jgi:signal transduction histidine kinase
VLLNLVSNAIKYGPAGSEVVARTAREADRVWISVVDEGPGIDPGDVERLFQPFERLAAHAGVKGTGLGLALSRNLMRAMGGEIGVRPAGVGSEFWLELRAARAALPRQRAAGAQAR